MPPKAARNMAGKGDGGYGKGGGKAAGKAKSAMPLRREMSEACQQVRAAPGPGQNMTREALIQRWRETKPKKKVLGFYGHGAYAGEHGSFSNFYESPFEFEMPAEFCALDLSAKERTFWVPFSEAAIMACKAAAMGDKASFDKITKSRGASQAKIKGFGREVCPFSDEIWNDIVCSVAYEVVFQKFAKVKHLQDILLRTGDCLMAEATSRDNNWGIGIDMGDTRVNDPCQWRGSNMLGWALMCARSNLSGLTIDDSAVPAAPAESEAAIANPVDDQQTVSTQSAPKQLEVKCEDSQKARADPGPVDSTECTEDAPASSGIESSNAVPEVQGNAAGSKSRKWRRRKDEDINNA